MLAIAAVNITDCAFAPPCKAVMFYANGKLNIVAAILLFHRSFRRVHIWQARESSASAKI